MRLRRLSAGEERPPIDDESAETEAGYLLAAEDGSALHGIHAMIASYIKAHNEAATRAGG